MRNANPTAFSAAAAAAVAAVVAVVVGSGAACDDGATVQALFPSPASSAPPLYGEAPFPSDLYLGDDGRIGVIDGISLIGFRHADKLQGQVSQLDGFGTRPVVQFFFDGKIDAGSVPAATSSVDDAVFVLDVDRASPTFGHVIPFDWRVEGGGVELRGAIKRGEVLEEGSHYAAFLTTKVRGAVNGHVGGSGDFSVLKNADPQTLRGGFRATREAFDVLGRNDVVAVAAFTTAHARQHLFRARAVLETLPAPAVAFDDPAVIFAGADRLHALLGTTAYDARGEERLGWSVPTGLPHDHIAAIGTGKLHGVTFRRVDKSGDARFDADSGTWSFAVSDDDPIGTPVVDREVDLPITFAVPQQAMPASGWPVVIFGHGLGGSRAQMLAFIETAARSGYATVAIDADGHGTRHTNVDETNNAGLRIGDAFTGTIEMRDGFGDVEGNGTALDVFHDFVNIAAMRDQMRESVMDLSQVTLALENGVDLSPLVAGARVDGSRVVYLGESFGGVLGALFLAVEPDVHMFYLDVPGGGVLEYIGPNSPTLSLFYKLFLPSTWGLEEDRKLDRFDPLIGMGSLIADGADPLTYARHVLRNQPTIAGRALGPRSVVVGEVVGDEIMPNSSTNALATALGIPILAPSFNAHPAFDVVAGPLAGNVVIDGTPVTAAMVQIAPANHGDNWSKEVGERKYMPFGDDDLDFVELDAPIPVNNPIRATHDQVQRLLVDFRDGQTPTLFSTCPPKHDFDDDGVDDDDDDDPFTP